MFCARRAIHISRFERSQHDCLLLRLVANTITRLSLNRIFVNVNVFHLLTHTSGIADDSEEEDGEIYEELWKTVTKRVVKAEKAPTALC